ncbi:Yfh7 protein [Starmerella bacillaris]|uniref:Yfh7 protein n=1 Tax=Starmerella bacillaris TaxID=1247836 RepID=A0AAV5RFD4_STABA|nr:Yfh7 protein [Starmerella bacillaris]
MSLQAESVSELVSRAESITSKVKGRVLIVINGVPGAGKTTIVNKVASALNAKGIKTKVVGMDGFHYPMKQLISMIGDDAYKFRGAPYTFDAAKVVEMARLLKCSDEDIPYPTFSHAIKDPVLDGLVQKDTRLILFEGNYLLLNDEPWDQIRTYADDTWGVMLNPNIVRKRIAQRHLDSGLVTTFEEGLAKADSNDLVNGKYIIEHSIPANIVYENT